MTVRPGTTLKGYSEVPERDVFFYIKKRRISDMDDYTADFKLTVREDYSMDFDNF